jgi:hypothetical protein
MDYSAALANYVQVKIEKEKLFTVALDGWFSRTNEGIYAINIVTKSGEEILYDVITMANNAASSGFLFSELKPILESLGRGKILAIVTDSAKNCKSLRDKCEQFSPNILNLSCFVHALNLICGKFLKIEKIDSVVSDCMRIISVFNYSNKLTAELKITNEMISSRGSRLAKVGNTRFSTHYDCISSLYLVMKKVSKC